MLVEEGYDVVGEAGSGEVALALVRELKPDLAILDVKMPGVDGLTAAAQIVDEDLCGVIMLTAFSQRELIATASEAGVLAYGARCGNRSCCGSEHGAGCVASRSRRPHRAP
jgi:two-component system, response regulator PdtaR